MSTAAFLAYMVFPVIAYVGVWKLILQRGERQQDEATPLAIETEPKRLQPGD